ncbi:MAG: hypothetical protein ACLP9Y_02155 [Mycobacterium sp.]
MLRNLAGRCRGDVTSAPRSPVDALWTWGRSNTAGMFLISGAGRNVSGTPHSRRAFVSTMLRADVSAISGRLRMAEWTASSDPMSLCP